MTEQSLPTSPMIARWRKKKTRLKERDLDSPSILLQLHLDSELENPLPCPISASDYLHNHQRQRHETNHISVRVLWTEGCLYERVHIPLDRCSGLRYEGIGIGPLVTDHTGSLKHLKAMPSAILSAASTLRLRIPNLSIHTAVQFGIFLVSRACARPRSSIHPIHVSAQKCMDTLYCQQALSYRKDVSIKAPVTRTSLGWAQTVDLQILVAFYAHESWLTCLSERSSSKRSGSVTVELDWNPRHTSGAPFEVQGGKIGLAECGNGSWQLMSVAHVRFPILAIVVEYRLFRLIAGPYLRGQARKWPVRFQAARAFARRCTTRMRLPEESKHQQCSASSHLLPLPMHQRGAKKLTGEIHHIKRDGTVSSQFMLEEHVRSSRTYPMGNPIAPAILTYKRSSGGTVMLLAIDESIEDDGRRGGNEYATSEGMNVRPLCHVLKWEDDEAGKASAF
ncbi:uncharacterized protein MYCFIDRAFT_174676 [Pseudocercospora fijiensis CIRAD86]|uniref:Uncharacterized protein n=1 Tax=Pseudocercospora fijiensis (strain CIRAD86) TaxID=383855 RepID=M2Z014_PSEFD|nr:uncharacterized protein MYCFIDRAFT_174676 [Pseudocercospora fijiensis CIRAD86]EME83200.1 hypothetical protein MYCFIDRAFT_174676 [Pseudocercospora fijiensis CIRAD86]